MTDSSTNMKSTMKLYAGYVSIIIMLPLTFLYFILKPCMNSDAWFSGFSQFLSLLPGQVGSYLRIGFYRLTMQNCHQNSVISFATLFTQCETEIGEGVYIGPQSNIGKCQIGSNCLLGSGVHIMSGKTQHNFSDLDVPIKDQGGEFTKIIVGEDSWIGNGTLIMANIGRHCIVGAGSVVIDDIEDYSIFAGNPAKFIKKRC